MSVEVPDVDDAYQRAQDNGAEIVDRLQDEDWGVRRFFLRTSAGHAMNELSHRGRRGRFSRDPRALMPNPDNRSCARRRYENVDK